MNCILVTTTKKTLVLEGYFLCGLIKNQAAWWECSSLFSCICRPKLSHFVQILKKKARWLITQRCDTVDSFKKKLSVLQKWGQSNTMQQFKQFTKISLLLLLHFGSSILISNFFQSKNGGFIQSWSGAVWWRITKFYLLNNFGNTENKNAPYAKLNH